MNKFCRKKYCLIWLQILHRIKEVEVLSLPVVQLITIVFLFSKPEKYFALFKNSKPEF